MILTRRTQSFADSEKSPPPPGCAVRATYSGIGEVVIVDGKAVPDAVPSPERSEEAVTDKSGANIAAFALENRDLRVNGTPPRQPPSDKPPVVTGGEPPEDDGEDEIKRREEDFRLNALKRIRKAAAKKRKATIARKKREAAREAARVAKEAEREALRKAREEARQAAREAKRAAKAAERRDREAFKAIAKELGIPLQKARWTAKHRKKWDKRIHRMERMIERGSLRDTQDLNAGGLSATRGEEGEMPCAYNAASRLRHDGILPCSHL